MNLATGKAALISRKAKTVATVGLPQHYILPITPCAADLPRLISHLQVPKPRVPGVCVWMVVVVVVVMFKGLSVYRDGVVLTRGRAEVHCGPTT